MWARERLGGPQCLDTLKGDVTVRLYAADLSISYLPKLVGPGTPCQNRSKSEGGGAGSGCPAVISEAAQGFGQ